ncbi:MAG: hypothetical protein KTR18_13355 [Acidiferrobacterales bacterium]|nr:hypothetical protein [Acidiferrobacterales bacterium]
MKHLLKLATGTTAIRALTIFLAGFSFGSSVIAWASDSNNISPISDTALPEDNPSLSKFDQLFSSSTRNGARYEIPFPFSNLIREIEQHLGDSINDDPNEVKLALFPLSRCVNRYAASPDFFKYPRVVLAVDSEQMNIGSQRNLFLKDQLFIGYQPQAQTLEVISYNNTAGRFDFQQVSDYSQTGQPKVHDAEPQDCVSCHQNHGPIFPKAYWYETEYNPKIFDAIVEAQDDAEQNHPFVSRHQVSAVNGAVNRANAISLYQTVWQKGCQSDDPLNGVLCRAAMFETVMLDQLAEDYRGQVPSTQVSRNLIDPMRKNIARFWPAGIELPSSIVPSENPLIKGAPMYLETASQLKQPRKETVRWRPNDLYRVVKGLGGLIANSDILRIDQTLDRITSNNGTGVESRTGSCRIRIHRIPNESLDDNQFNGDVGIDCHWKEELSGELNLLGDLYIDQGKVRRQSGLNNVMFGGRDFLIKFTHEGGKLDSSNGETRFKLNLLDSNGKLRARLPNGSTIDSLLIHWNGLLTDTESWSGITNAIGKATLKIRSNPRVLEKAIAELANSDHSEGANVFAMKPFSARKIVTALMDTLEKIETQSLQRHLELSQDLSSKQSGFASINHSTSKRHSIYLIK